MSLGSDISSDGTDPLSRAVDAAVDAGIVAVVSAGNSGSWSYTIGAPAAAEKAITVCAMQDAGKQGWSLAQFSSRGPTADNRIKPDICAPGDLVTAAKAGTADEFISMSGTSMASPFVAGVAALMLEANPYLTPSEIKRLLATTAQDWGPAGKDVDYGWGRLNAYRAVQRVLGAPGLGPSNPNHSVGKGTVPAGGDMWYRVTVTDPSRPIALTMVQSGVDEQAYDLDLILWDGDGNPLIWSQDTERQETIHFQAPARGVYYVQIESYEGSGAYTLDISFR